MVPILKNGIYEYVAKERNQSGADRIFTEGGFLEKPAAGTLGEITISISIKLKKYDGNTVEIDRALRGGQARSVK